VRGAAGEAMLSTSPIDWSALLLQPFADVLRPPPIRSTATQLSPPSMPRLTVPLVRREFEADWPGAYPASPP
jgi:hypothetical protein